ncbi:MAG: T9SS type A sorting domain-containing protein [Bacteroidales bacterium]
MNPVKILSTTILVVIIQFCCLNAQANEYNYYVSRDICSDEPCNIDPDNIEITVSPASCSNLNDGSIVVEINHDNPFMISLSVGCHSMNDPKNSNTSENSPTVHFNNLAPGYYGILITDTDECMFYKCVEVTAPTEIFVDYSFESIYCFGHTTDILFSVSGGTPPYIITGVEGEQLAIFDEELVLEYIPAGEYSWIVTDSDGCYQQELNLTIPEPAPLLATLLSLEHNFCNGEYNGSAVISVTGGTEPYYSDAGTFEDEILTLDSLPAGSHTITFSDSKNCGPGEITFEIEEPEEIQINIIEIKPYETDISEGHIIAGVTGGTPPYSISINDGCETDENAVTQLFNQNQEIFYNGLDPGWRIITVRDQNECVATVCVEIKTEIITDISEKPENYNALHGEPHRFNVYPNPSGDIVNIDIIPQVTSLVTLDLFDVSGRKIAVILKEILKQDQLHNYSFNAQNIPDGIYLLRLSDEMGVRHQKIIITR